MISWIVDFLRHLFCHHETNFVRMATLSEVEPWNNKRKWHECWKCGKMVLKR